MQIFRSPTISLQSGVLGGVFVISSTTALITVVLHSEDIFSSIEERISKTKEFFSNHIYPLFTYYSESLNSLFMDLKGWYEYLSSKWEVVKQSLYLENFSESFREVFSGISNWTYIAVDFIRNKGSYLVSDWENIRYFLYKIFQNFSGFFSLLFSFFEALIKNKPNISSFTENTVNLFKENMGVIGFMKRKEYIELFGYIAKDEDSFKRRIEYLRNDKDGKRNWGRYEDWKSMKEELFPSKELKTKELIRNVTKAYIECKKEGADKKECWKKEVTMGEIKEFKNLFQKEEFRERIKRDHKRSKQKEQKQ